jgi:hypothetical protein
MDVWTGGIFVESVESLEAGEVEVSGLWAAATIQQQIRKANNLAGKVTITI